MLSKHLLVYLMPNLAQVIASFGTVAILTRFLSPEEYGRFSLIFVIMTIAHYAFLTWAEAAANRFYANAKKNNNLNNHFSTLISAYLLNCILFFVFACLFLILYKTDKISQIALAAAFAGSIVKSLLKISLETRRMNLEAMRFASIETFNILAGFIFTILFVVVFGFKQDGAFLAIFVSAALALIFELPSLLKAAKDGKPNKETFAEYAKFGTPLAFGLILTIILNYGDRFVIGALLGDAQVGIYSAGYQIAARILDIVFVWAASASFPLLVSAYEGNNNQDFKQAAINSFTLRFGIGAPAALGIALVSAPLCEILIGPQMRDEAARIAPFIALGSLILGMSDYFSDAFILTKKIIYRTILMIIPTVFNIGLNIILLPKIGLNGAIFATICANIIGLVAIAFFGRKYLKLPIPYIEIGKIIIACLIMALFVSLIPKFGGFIELIIKGVIGALIYAFMAISLNIANTKQFWEKLKIKFSGVKNG